MSVSCVCQRLRGRIALTMKQKSSAVKHTKTIIFRRKNRNLKINFTFFCCMGRGVCCTSILHTKSKWKFLRSAPRNSVANEQKKTFALRFKCKKKILKNCWFCKYHHTRGLHGAKRTFFFLGGFRGHRCSDLIQCSTLTHNLQHFILFDIFLFSIKYRFYWIIITYSALLYKFAICKYLKNFHTPDKKADSNEKPFFLLLNFFSSYFFDRRFVRKFDENSIDLTKGENCGETWKLRSI